jgi:Methylamine utilisation protein MauE
VQHSDPISLMARAFVAIVLVAASGAKLTNRAAFSQSLSTFALFPKWSLTTVSYFVPSVELLVAGLLLARPTAVVGSAAAAFLFGAFALLIAWLRFARPSAQCGCFGGAGRVQWQLLTRNVAFLLFALAGIGHPLMPYLVCAGTTLLLASAFTRAGTVGMTRSATP